MKVLSDSKVLAEKSRASFGVAENWMEAADYDSAAGRFYYSVLQAVLYYALRNQCYELKKYESGAPGYSIHGLMGRVAGQISKQFKRTFFDLYEVRRQADYRSNHVCKDDLIDIIEDAKKLVRFALAA